ncbi:Putative DNA-invertase from lambdoid prophage Rac [Mariniflexile rhizosphaerae]|uniref:recombinase family protein n=1 Tax=unclassified Mariniflexile TaxID=2643887 RepID=UPI000E334215|nr:recombinase family protein [Mariniflexile sp. TRM1-10]AXP79801.1 Putative DNA-invertase from lambdoid prophage Rac [Mariniflexile sp. TRM1-10]
MNKIADLYIRVSTDEQADKGYSQRNQEEMLCRYCQLNAIEIRNVIFEDHSAKSFNRPQWKKLIQNLKKNKNKTNLVLFTKWDRFSRNASDAYQMIGLLKHLGVEPQAIEQPLDLSIPENKMMLAFYLAAPEVENDRRALNTFYGMRRAKKEGRYMGLAPTGYENKIRDDGKKYIRPKEPEASIIKWVFNELSRGIFNTEQVYKMAKQKGLKSSKSNFWTIIRNPIYCGKIYVPKFKDEEGGFVQSQHQGLISEVLFNLVQAILDGRGRTYRTKIQTKEDFPLRGFLKCPNCNKLLTASKSKGRNKYYAYYHCKGSCNYRIRTEVMNAALLEELKKYVPKDPMKNVFKTVLIETYFEMTKEMHQQKKQVSKEISHYQERLSYAKELLITKKIEPTEYSEMKLEYSQVVDTLKLKLTTLNSNTIKLEGLLSNGIERSMSLLLNYNKGNIASLRNIIGSIFSEPITFNGDHFLSPKTTSAISIIYDYNR